MRIATQNLNWGGEPTAPGCDGLPRLKRLVSWLEGLNADLFVLTEYKSGPLGDELKELLANAGFAHFLSHTQAPFTLGTAIASRRPFTIVELPIAAATEPWRSIGVDVDGLTVFGFYFPLKDAKSPYWDWILANAALLRDREVLLIGDFNTGKFRIDEAGETFDCQEKVEALEQLGFVDTWRAAYPKGRDYTWYSTYGNGFRLDYIWASSLLAPRIQRAWHDHEPRLTLSSDHSAVIVDMFHPEEDPLTDSVEFVEEPKVLKNIFKLSQSNGPENQFTAAWGYVLHRDLVLAQAVAEILLQHRGLNVKVIRVTDHPKLNSFKQPDFCIECEGFNILVEHKLDALLHEKQLENYLDLDPTRNYLALIAPAYQTVPEMVLRDARYLKPEGKAHFRWSDFYEAVKSRPGWLAQEFADYMSSLGMAPFTLRGAEDIFDRSQKPVQFEEALKLAASKVFITGYAGCSLRGTRTGLGREVRTPLASLTLVYIWAEQRSTYFRDFDGPALAVNVYERKLEEGGRLEDASLLTPSGFLVRRHNLAKPLKQGEGFCRTTYVAPLDMIIQETREATVQRIEEILVVVHSDHWPDAALECG
jgi:exodeoxyribonuclease-3